MFAFIVVKTAVLFDADFDVIEADLSGREAVKSLACYNSWVDAHGMPLVLPAKRDYPRVDPLELRAQ